MYYTISNDQVQGDILRNFLLRCPALYRHPPVAILLCPLHITIPILLLVLDEHYIARVCADYLVFGLYGNHIGVIVGMPPNNLNLLERTIWASHKGLLKSPIVVKDILIAASHKSVATDYPIKRQRLAE